MSKVVVLASGGLDSTTLLAQLLKAGHDCHLLTINYGQRHVKEIHAAEAVSQFYDMAERWNSLDLSNLKELIRSALSGEGDIPNGHYSDEIQKATVFPNRNMILLGIAAGFAATINGSAVAYAAHSNDRAIYPDCRPEFIHSVNETIKLGTDGQIELLEPFEDLTKAQIALKGHELEAPLHLTWSCYKGEERPCLTCGTCLERTEAFYKAGLKDPALSNEEWLDAMTALKKYIQ